MANMQIEPAEGMVALEFLDDGDEKTESYRNDPGEASEGIFAMCVGVGRDVKRCKRGDTVIVDKWAREGMKVGDGVILVDQWAVKGTVKVSK